MSRFNLAEVVHMGLASPGLFLAELTFQVQAEWASQARSHLRASARSVAAYVAGLTVDVTDERGLVQLLGVLPNMLEQGMGPGGIGTQGAYDLRTFLLRPTTQNIRHGKRGLYLHVPFDHDLASIKALGGTAAVKAAKNLAASVTLRSHGGARASTTWGGRLPAGMTPNARPNDIALPGGAIGRAHATDRLAGLMRMQSQYQGVTAPQSTYRTFRTISEGGKPWMSRGIVARHLADRVVAAIPRLLEGLR